MAVIEDLANEILGICFDGCTLRQLIRCSKVSRRWRSAAHAHPLFWKNVELRHHQRGGGVFLFAERLNASTGRDIEVTLLCCDSRAIQAVITNMHRIAGLTLGRDELRILSSFQCPAPALRTLNLCGGLFSAAHHPVGRLLGMPNMTASRFLCGHAPNLHTVSLDNCSFLFYESNVVPFPSVVNVSISLSGTESAFMLFGQSGVIVLNSTARLFPNARSLTFNLGYLNYRSWPTTQDLPPSWTTSPIEPVTTQWFQLLRQFHCRGYAVFWLANLPISTIPDVSTELLWFPQASQIFHTVFPHFTAFVPPQPFCALSSHGQENEEVALSTLAGIRRRIYSPHAAYRHSMDPIYGAYVAYHHGIISLGWWVEAAQDRLIAWSTDSTWLRRCSLKLPHGTIFAALRVLAIEINASNDFCIAFEPPAAHLAFPNIRKLVLYTRRIERHDDAILPLAVFHRLMSFFVLPQGVTLELRGVRVPDWHSSDVGEGLLSIFAHVIMLDEIDDTESDWFLDLQRALTTLQ